MIRTTRRHWIGAATCFAAAIVFWLPAIVVPAVSGTSFDGAGVLLLTVACPAAAHAVFRVLRARVQGCSLRTKAAAFLLGIWYWGPPCMMVGATFSGGGFQVSTSPAEFLRMWALFPVVSPLFATYDGTLLALGVTTLALLAVLVRGTSAGTKAAETSV